MTAEVTVACADDCWTLTMRGTHDTQDDREYLNEVGVPANVADLSGATTTCENCGAGITVDWADESDGGDE